MSITQRHASDCATEAAHMDPAIAVMGCTCGAAMDDAREVDVLALSWAIDSHAMAYGAGEPIHDEGTCSTDCAGDIAARYRSAYVDLDPAPGQQRLHSTMCFDAECPQCRSRH